MDFLGEINFNELGTSGTITLLLVVFTVVGFIRGAVKLVFMLFSLAGAGYAAYWGAEVAYVRALESWVDAPAWLSDAIALGAGLFAFFILSKIFSFFIEPFETSSFLGRFVVGIPAAIISLTAAIGLVWGSLIFLKSKGAESELRYWMSQDETEGTKLTSYPTMAVLKQSFEESFIGEKVMGFYKVGNKNEHTLAKLLIIEKVSSEKLFSLADNVPVRNLFENPRMIALREDPTVALRIEENNVKGLLHLLKRPLDEILLRVDVEEVDASELK